MPNGEIDLNQTMLDLFVGQLQREFEEIERLRQWIRNYFTFGLVDDILVTPGLQAKVKDLVDWAEAEGHLHDLLQALCDHPPKSADTIVPIVNLFSNGTIKPSGGGPVMPHKSWLVTQRPFVNRQTLRDELETFDAAQAGADSVLIIEGDQQTGKSHGVRLAKACAPPKRFTPIDVKDWGETGLVNAGDLAQAIAGADIVPAFDPTKEDAEVPRLLRWLTDRFRNLPSTWWVIVDSINRPTLTRPARELLVGLAAKLERGDLANVRMILVGIARATLPESLSWQSRHDKAELPTADEARKWCESLANEYRKKFTKADIDEYLAEVFAGHPDPANARVDAQFERRLYSVYTKIMALEQRP